MIPVLTHHAQQSLNTVRGVYLLLDIFRKASYLDYCEGVIVCPAPYKSLIELGSYGYNFSYQKEFSFVGSVDFILTIHVNDIIHRILKTVSKPDCHVTFQKKKRKK